MKYLKQFCLILLISFVSEGFSLIIPLPIPGSIYGIIILFVCLETKIIALDAVKETGKFLVEIMPAMFIPAAAGLINCWGLIRASLLPYVLLTVLSTFVVMAVSGRVTQRIIRKGAKKHE